jgi:hypothetical protein
MMNDAPLKPIAAVKVTINIASHVWTYSHIW